MTDGQKAEINELRAKGIGYLKITGMVGASINTEKLNCREVERSSDAPV